MCFLCTSALMMLQEQRLILDIVVYVKVEFGFAVGIWFEVGIMFKFGVQFGVEFGAEFWVEFEVEAAV